MSTRTQSRSDKPTTRSSNPGTTRITLDELQNLHLAQVPGLANTNYMVVAIFDGTGPVKLGLVETIPKLKPLDDLRKLSQAPRIIRGEESLENKEEGVIVARTAIARMERANLHPKVKDNFQSELAAMSQRVKHLDNNEVLLNSNKNSDYESKLANLILSSAIRRIRIAIEGYIISLGTSEKITFSEIYRSHGICDWIARKLSLGSINVTPTSNVMRVFFPIKTDNGIKLSIGELRDPMISAVIGELTLNSRVIVSLANNDDLLLLLGGAKTTLESDPDWRRILDFKVFLIPTMNWYEYSKQFVSFPAMLAQNNKNGPLERVTRMVFDAYVVNPVSNRIGDFLQNYGIPPESIDRESSEKPRSQALRALKEKGNEIIDRINDPAFIANLVAMFAPLNEEQSKGLKAFEIKIPIAQKLEPLDNDFHPYQLAPLTDVEREIAKAATGAATAIKLPKQKQRQTQPLIALTKRARSLVQDLTTNPNFKRISEQVANYLRGFHESEFQDAAVKLMAAYVDAKSDIDTNLRSWADEEEDSDD